MSTVRSVDVLVKVIQLMNFYYLPFAGVAYGDAEIAGA